MKPLSLNLRSAKKIAGDEHSSTFHLSSGHQIRIAHKALSTIQRKQIAEMPIHKMADGGNADSTASTSEPNADLMAELDHMSHSHPVAEDAPLPSGAQVGDGGYYPDIPSDVSRSPASWASDAGNFVGNTLRKGFSDAAGAFKTIAAPVGEATEGLVHGLAGIPEPAANAATATPTLPTAQTNLPDMGTPIGTPSRDPSATPASAPIPSMMGNAPNISPEGIYKQGMAGINAQQQAEQQGAQAQLQASQNYGDQLKQEEANWENERQAKMNEINNAIQDVQNGHINPNHYVENMSVPQKVATAIGLILGGAGAHSTGGQNMALNYLNDQINRDVESQKANLQNKATVLGAYFDKYKNAAAAEAMTRATQYGIYANQLQQAAAKAADPMAKARALQASSALQSQMLPYVMRANAIDMINRREQEKAANPGAFGSQPVDYGTFNALQRTGLMPKEDVAAATKEAGTLEHLRGIQNQYNQAFDALSHKALAGKLTPADRDAQINLLAAQMQKLASNRFNIDELKNIISGSFPSPGDLQSTLSDKRLRSNQFFESEGGATPTLDRYGLKNTAPSTASARRQFRVGDVFFKSGQKYQIVDKSGRAVPVS